MSELTTPELTPETATEAEANVVSKAAREVVVEKMTDNLKSLYTLALRADEELDILRKQNKGKFTAIFQKDSPFKAQSDRFLPYMVEVADELGALLSVDDADYIAKLKTLMRKVQLLNGVLAKFHAIADGEPAQSEPETEPRPESREGSPSILH